MFSESAKKLPNMNNIFFWSIHQQQNYKGQHNDFLGNFQKNRFQTLILFCAILFAKWWNNVCRHRKINLGLIVKIQCGIIKIISHTCIHYTIQQWCLKAVVIGGDNLPFSSWQRVNWAVKKKSKCVVLKL